jgi:hypothetical protein
MTGDMPVERLFTFYMLDQNNNVVPATMMEYATWMQETDRTIAFKEEDGVIVSTVFLGVDMGIMHGFDSDPVVFETMVFCDPRSPLWKKYDRISVRYRSYENAIKGHNSVLETLRRAQQEGA